MLINQIKQTDLETIHEKTLYLLEHMGVDFEHPELLELYRKQASAQRETVCISTERQWSGHCPQYRPVLY